MKKNVNLSLLILIVFFVASCGKRIIALTEENEVQKIRACRENWRFEDLPEDKKDVKVLLFENKSEYSIHSFATFVICVHEDDTFSIIDKDYYHNVIKNGSLINLKVHKWTDREKEIYKPIFFFSKDTLVNKLFCSVKVVFWGRIE